MANTSLEWHGDEVLQHIRRQVDSLMTRAGQAGVDAAKQLVPVRTGKTQASLGFTYDRSRQLLQLHAETPWALFIEMGTRHTPARPFLRPGLNAAAKVFEDSGGTV